MTDEQINIAIAESLGWTNCRLVIKGAGGGTRYPTAHGMPPNRKYESSCPNYTSDLNACHEFESEIIYSNDRLPKKYTQQIKSAICREAGVKKAQMDFDLCITATARQRCEAYLRTLGRWKDTDHA